MIPLELFFEEEGSPSYDLPEGLERRYGRRLGFEGRVGMRTSFPPWMGSLRSKG